MKKASFFDFVVPLFAVLATAFIAVAGYDIYTIDFIQSHLWSPF